MTQLTIIDVFFFPYDIMIFRFVKTEIRRHKPPYPPVLLFAEGLAVGALVRGGIGLVGTHQNPIQAAEVCVLTVMLALLNGTLDALVCMTIHSLFSSLSLGCF